ncbi:MAG: hypothetical protein R2769_06720 [Saprospiraceae bacterium]
MGIPAVSNWHRLYWNPALAGLPLPVEANNHFGIKCKSDWTGQSFYKKDDDFDEEKSYRILL